MRLFLATILLAVPLHAQLRETVEVNILELDLAVVDRAGKPVEGLTRADFDVQIGGKAKAVTNFYAVKRGAIVDEPVAAARAEAIAPETTIPTTVVLFVDDMHLSIRSKLRAIEALKEYVRASVGPSTSASLENILRLKRAMAILPDNETKQTIRPSDAADVQILRLRIEAEQGRR